MAAHFAQGFVGEAATAEAGVGPDAHELDGVAGDGGELALGSDRPFDVAVRHKLTDFVLFADELSLVDQELLLNFEEILLNFYQVLLNFYQLLLNFYQLLLDFYQLLLNFYQLLINFHQLLLDFQELLVDYEALPGVDLRR